MMQCERCGSGAEAIFRVRTDILDMLVCSGCGKEALTIGIPLEAVDYKNASLPPEIRDSRDKGRLLPRNAHV
jgi:hypothetical protein